MDQYGIGDVVFDRTNKERGHGRVIGVTANGERYKVLWSDEWVESGVSGNDIRPAVTAEAPLATTVTT